MITKKVVGFACRCYGYAVNRRISWNLRESTIMFIKVNIVIVQIIETR